MAATKPPNDIPNADDADLTSDELFEITESECDGIFLILDAARHNGWSVKRSEIREHVAECRSCQRENGDLSWM